MTGTAASRWPDGRRMALRPMPTEAFETRFAALLQQHRERLLGFLRRLSETDADVRIEGRIWAPTRDPVPLARP